MRFEPDHTGWMAYIKVREVWGLGWFGVDTSPQVHRAQCKRARGTAWSVGLAVRMKDGSNHNGEGSVEAYEGKRWLEPPPVSSSEETLLKFVVEGGVFVRGVRRFAKGNPR